MVNVPKEELFAVARQSIERNGADYILANDLKDIGENQHIAYLVDKTREIQAQTKDEIAQLILNTLEKENKMANITLAVTGSISAYKAADLTSQLTKLGHRVTVLMSRSAMDFITPLTLQSLSKIWFTQMS